MTEFESVNDLIRELIKIRDKHGNLPTIHNDIQLEITGISYKYLIIYSNYRPERKKEENDARTDAKEV